MAVTLGSARIDENGNAMGGKAGDQTGNELSTQNWYKHTKGWRVLRCKDAAKAKLIAQAMKAACANNNIGYDQGQNQTLWNAVKNLGYDPAKVTTPVETDCARLVRVCVAYAGIIPADFYTETLAAALLATGQFVELTGSQYTNESTYLKAGDVLVTKTKGHTVVVLTDGPKAEATIPQSASVSTTQATGALGSQILKHGMSGEPVKELQTALKELGYFTGSIGGNYLDLTEAAVKAFQMAEKLLVDGEYGPKSHAALTARMGAIVTGNPATDTTAQPVEIVLITGGNVNVRAEPNANEETKILGVAKNGTTLLWGGDVAPNGWVSVEWEDKKGWVSPKYGKRGQRK